MTTEPTALQRLSAEQRRDLDSIAVSWEMEGQTLPAAEQEVLARYILGEISFDESQRQMIALVD